MATATIELPKELARPIAYGKNHRGTFGLVAEQKKGSSSARGRWRRWLESGFAKPVGPSALVHLSIILVSNLLPGVPGGFREAGPNSRPGEPNNAP
jgi:hypothetical protein